MKSNFLNKIGFLVFSLILFTFLMYFLSTSVEAAENNNWPTFQGDLQHSGFSAVESVLKPPLVVDWIFSGSGRGTAGIAVVDGIAYAGIGNEVMALDVKSGRKLWSFKFQGYEENVAIQSSIAYDQGTLFMVSDPSKIYALNAKTGEPKWNFTAKEGSFNNGPIFANSLAYWGTESGKLLAVRSGSFLWQFDGGGKSVSTPTYADGKIYVGSKNGLFALNPLTGSQIWAFTSNGGTIGSPAYADGVVYVGSHDFNLYALEARTGALLWKYKTGESILDSSAPAIAYGNVYFGSTDFFFYAVDQKTGKLRWRQQFRASLDYAPPVVANGYVYVGNGSYLQAYDAKSGQLVWDYELGTAKMGPLAIADGRLIFGTGSGKVYAFKSSGKPLIPPPQLPSQTEQPFVIHIKSLILPTIVLMIILGLIMYRRRKKQ